jgi:diguanylate cyclase (GGDEF)-like protein/PAS domain S-box-containing protein
MGNQAEANLSALIESTDDLIWSVDLEDRLVAFNRALQQNILNNFGHELRLGLAPADFLPPERAASWPLFYRRARERGAFRVEYALADGRILEMAFSLIVEDGKATGVSVFGKDISERKRAEEALRVSGDFLTEAQRIGNLGCYLLDFADGNWKSTPQLDEIFGIDEGYPRTVEGWLKLVHPEERAQMDAYFLHEVVEQRKDFDREYRIIRQRDGAELWVHGMGHLDFDADGKPRKMRGTIRDITGHKQAEIAVAESERLFRAISGTSPLVMGLISGIDGSIEYINPTFIRLFGYSLNEIPTVTAWWPLAYPDPEYRKNVQLKWQTMTTQAFQTGRAVEPIELTVACKDGSKKIVEWGVVSLGNRSLAYGLDITERKAVEDKLLQSMAQLQLFVDHAPVSLAMFDREMRYLMASRRWKTDYGLGDRDLRGLSHYEIFPEIPERWKEDHRRVLAGESLCAEEDHFLRADGSEQWIRWILRPWYELSGAIGGIVIFTEEITERKQAETARRKSEELYRTVFQTSADGIALSQMSDGRYIDVNKAFLRIMGCEREDVIGKTSLELKVWINPEDRNKMVSALNDFAEFRDMQTRYVKKNGEIVWVQISASAIQIEGRPCILSVVRDVTAAKAAEERLKAADSALRLSEQRYRTAFQTSLDAININRFSDGRYIDVNEAFLEITGYARDEIIGRTSVEMGIWANARDRKTMAGLVSQSSVCRGLEVQFRKKDGKLFWGQLSASVMEVDGEPCILSITRDLTEAKAAQDEIRSLAFYDPLTGLPNRRMLLERLHNSLASAGSGRPLQALLLIDLDNFKVLNDTLGHRTSDLLLKEVGQRISGCTREPETVARLGGDEFVVMIEELSTVAEEAAAQARNAAERILVSVGEPYQVGERESLSTASIGIAVFGDRESRTEGILQQAEIALHLAKADGRNAIRFFSPALQVATNARATLEGDLRAGIKSEQFLLYYQPQVDRGRLTGCEALIRWMHPTRGLVAPNDFIPLAEESRLILPLGDWVLETACKQIAVWARREETADLTVAVNISAMQFRQPEFVQHVLSALERTGANSKSLKLELTESLLVDNFEDVIAKMAELKSHGLSFSLDDFGTGYSSLAYLKRLPLDQLKIDRTFVRDMMVDLTSGAIAQTIIALGRAMDLSVVAEGVETEEQRGFLAGMGCHSFQGFLISRPLPLDEFESLVDGFN